MSEAPEEPEVPTPPPEVPKNKLWATLLIPPVLTVIGTFVAGATYNSNNYGMEFLAVLPVGLLTILCCLITFINAWKVRYRGRSLVLTSIGYVLGQIILCLGLWFGTCLLFVS